MNAKGTHTMRRIGLALSGGGFRATLFHLGLVRFLREAGVLPSISHITSVSGGSILAAHLTLNWHRYTGADHEFDAAAREVLDFVRLDVRNRIIRRYPLAMPIRALQRLSLQRPARQLTRTGLLEYHYEQYLLGDTSLFELPESPQLHILATNLSEGCLCSFTRSGLLMQKRLPGHRFRFDRVHVGLATVPMAVAASSAFPGFFPPIELTAAEVGANEGEFSRQAFTDGGVFDNLGVRMFRCLERSWMARELPLRREDFVDVERGVALVQSANGASVDTPVGWLAQQIDLQCTRPRNEAIQTICPELGDRLVAGVWDVVLNRDLSREPAFDKVRPADDDAQTLLRYTRDRRRELDPGEQMWLNRQLLDAAFQEANGRPCFRGLNSCFDCVLVSDAGKPFRTLSHSRTTTLLGTAMRASDILMDRVWQLEKDTFEGTPGFLFAPMTRVVDPADDPTALHPEVQCQTAGIRTDLDRFSDLEISNLVRHGYCVGRHACKAHPDLFGDRLPDGPPWDPTRHKVETGKSAPPGHGGRAAATEVSRKLQASAGRRIGSRLLDYRDWTTFIYVPLLVPILLVLPWYAARAYQRSQIQQHFMEAVSQSSPDFTVMKTLLQDGTPQPWKGVDPEEVRALASPNYDAFEVISDSRIFDFRAWKVNAAGQPEAGARAYGYRRLRVRKKTTDEAPPAKTPFIVHAYASVSKADLRFPDQRLRPSVRLCKPEGGRGKCAWEMEFDFTKVPPGETVELLMELMAYDGLQIDADGEHGTPFVVEAPTAAASVWMLMPQGRDYRSFNLIRYPSGHPEQVQSVEPSHEYLADDHSVIAFSMLSVKPGHIYECRWTFR